MRKISQQIPPGTCIATIAAALIVFGGCSGCSDESRIAEKTEWVCQYDQHESPSPVILPDEYDLEEYVDVEEIEIEEESGFFDQAFKPIAVGANTAIARHAECDIEEIEVEDDWARVEFTREVPDPDVGFEVFDEFDGDTDESEVEQRYHEWIADSDETTTSEHTLAFRRTDDGWRAHPVVERNELMDEFEEVEERLEELTDVEEYIEELEQVDQRLEELEHEIDERLDETRDNLEDFEILSANLRERESRFRTDTIIELHVENNSDHPISRVYFEGEYATPDRAVPWEEGSFNYSISGGLEPGESAEWSLQPSIGNNFYGTEARSDAELQLDVVALDGPDGNTLWDIRTDRFGWVSMGEDFDALIEEQEELEDRAEVLPEQIDELKEEHDRLQQRAETLEEELREVTPEILRD